jgi:hypothetical protein
MCRTKDCPRKAIKGKSMCNQCEFEAEQRTAKAQVAAQGK